MHRWYTAVIDLDIAVVGRALAYDASHLRPQPQSFCMSRTASIDRTVRSLIAFCHHRSFALTLHQEISHQLVVVLALLSYIALRRHRSLVRGMHSLFIHGAAVVDRAGRCQCMSSVAWVQLSFYDI